MQKYLHYLCKTLHIHRNIFFFKFNLLNKVKVYIKAMFDTEKNRVIELSEKCNMLLMGMMYFHLMHLACFDCNSIIRIKLFAHYL